jgi:hypothetical protein
VTVRTSRDIPALNQQRLFTVEVDVIVYAFECEGCDSLQIVPPFDRVAIVAVPA